MGYSGSGEVGMCKDVDACITSPCGDFARCKDLPAPHRETVDGRLCECDAGYRMDGAQCTEINACVSNPCGDANHASFATCIDKPAPSGDSADGRLCVCSAPLSLFKVQGNVEVCACEDGTKMPQFGADGVVACTKDADACVASPCGVGAICLDQEGGPGGPLGRTCTCPLQGTLLNTTNACVCKDNHHPAADGSCMPVNACINNPCEMKGQACADTGGPDDETGRTCSCVHPFVEADAELGGCRCADNHEASLESCAPTQNCAVHPCPEHADCTEDAGAQNGRTCTCKDHFESRGGGGACTLPKGFEYDPRTESAVPIDYCAKFPCTANARCSLNADFFDVRARTCTCEAGFATAVIDGKDACVSEDEGWCELQNPCSNALACNNKMADDGSFAGVVCSNCKPGYVVDGASPVGDCVEVDECTAPRTAGYAHTCGPEQTCLNLAPPNTYDCVCGPGRKNGGGDASSTCLEANACLNFPCPSTETHFCVDRPSPDFVDNSEGRECVDIDACVHNECTHAYSKCTDTKDAPDSPEGRTCACINGFVYVVPLLVPWASFVTWAALWR